MNTNVNTAVLLVFTGNANRPLATAICAELNVPMGKAMVGRFSDGELQVEIEENVRRQEVFVVQPTCAPTADNFMELLALVDALKRASAASVTAVIPYLGYARQDRRPRSARVPITAKVAAKMIGSVGTDRVLTVDLHADQIQGFFDIPLDNVYASPVLLADIWRDYGNDDLIVVSPDVGGVVRARALAKRLDDADLAIIDKRRPRANEATVMNIIGEVKRQGLRARRRHRRHRRHAVRGGGGAEEERCAQGRRVLHASGAVGAGDPESQWIGARRAGRHRHDSVVGGGEELHEDPPAVGGGASGGNDSKDCVRRVGEFAVRRLKESVVSGHSPG